MDSAHIWRKLAADMTHQQQACQAAAAPLLARPCAPQPQHVASLLAAQHSIHGRACAGCGNQDVRARLRC
jgi:hypothetical protein